MHPIERLRYVARADGAGPSLLVREAAGALAGFADDPAGLVTACRRLVDRHPATGPMWWLAARVLGAADARHEAWAAADELDADPTPDVLAAHLPPDFTVATVGWPEHIALALRRRADLETLVIDSDGQGPGLVRRLEAAGCEAVDVRESGLGSAVAGAGLVLLEATALGPDGFVGSAGVQAAAAVAALLGVPVWVVAGTGRVLPGRLWEALVRRLAVDPAEPWDRPDEHSSLGAVDQVVGPDGPQPVAQATKRADCPIAPELLKPVGGWSAGAPEVD